MDNLLTSFINMVSIFMEANMTIFIVTIIFILLDILSGCIAGLINHTFSSTQLRKGLGHKIGYVFLMCAVAILQVAMFDPNFNLDFDFPLFNVVCCFIIFMEFISILENASKLNPNIDKLIGKYFDKNDTENINITSNFGEDYSQPNLFDIK